MTQKNSIHKLVYNSPQFYSHLDQLMFFEWCRWISCIDRVIEEGGNVLIILKPKELPEGELYELIYLFKRYGIDMTQLRPYLTKKIALFFESAKMLIGMNHYLERLIMSVNNESLTNQIILVCLGVTYYGLTDEEIFFDSLERIKCIQDVDGSGRELYLHIASSIISDDDLRSLIGLFYRYQIDMKQLKKFLTDSNRSWFFEDTTTFWHDKVFGSN